MKQVTARSVDTYVTPDRSELNAVSKRQQQVSSAFESLGVVLKQKVAQDKATSKAARKAQEAQDKAELKLQSEAAKAKIKLAVSDLSQVQNRFMKDEDMRQNEYFQTALAAIKGIDDENAKQLLNQSLNDELAAVLQGHQQTVRREDNMTMFGTVVADTLQTEYDASSINKLVSEHKVALGEDTLPELSRIAISLEEIPAINALLDRDDLHPETIARLNSAKSRIEEAQAKAAKADKTQLYFSIDQANNIEDRSERFDAKLEILEQYDDQLTSSQRGKLKSDLVILNEEIKSEQLVELTIGDRSTTELADPANYPEGVRALPIGDIKRIHNRLFQEAVADGDLSAIAKLTRDPTDLPTAARDYFGSFMSDVKGADKDNLDDSILARWDQAKTLESVMGPAKMQALLGANDYSKYQILSGIGAQEGLAAAVSRLQDYEMAIANGRPPAPEGFTGMKRAVISDVVNELEDIDWSLRDRDVDVGAVTQALTPYFKVWGAMGLDESQMKEMAQTVIGRSAWAGMIGGRVAKEHFDAIHSDTDGPIYDESPEELFDMAKELQTARFREIQSTLPEELNVRPLPVDPSKLYFTSPDGTPIINSIISLQTLTDLVKDNTLTRKQKLLDGETRNRSRRN